jgi:hypothetical protein
MSRITPESVLLAVMLVRSRRLAGQRTLIVPLERELAHVRFFYFGTYGSAAGHYWHHALDTTTGRRPIGLPWDKWDGVLAPVYKPNSYGDDAPQPEGVAWVHYRAGWTAVSYWDRSGPDTRKGSNTGFFADRVLTFEQMMVLARRYFPVVINRATFPIFEERQ